MCSTECLGVSGAKRQTSELDAFALSPICETAKKKRNWKVRAPPGQPWRSHLPYTATAQRWPRPGWSREKTLRGDLGVRSVLNRGDPSGRWMSAEVMASPRRPGQSLRELSVTSYHRSCSRSALLELSQEVPGFARYTRLPGILSQGILTRREHEEKSKTPALCEAATGRARWRLQWTGAALWVGPACSAGMEPESGDGKPSWTPFTVHNCVKKLVRSH